jgi:protein tyrosine/serine phosphatase
MSDEELKESANFRTKNRVPTLTYRYHNGCCIWRSSQTKSGFNSSNKYDIDLISRISDGTKLKVYDARPYINAMANKLKGAGFENVDDYISNKIDVELIFCGIANIHAVRNSYYKILNNVSYNISEECNIYTNIVESEWYDVIIKILKSSFQIYNSIFVNNNNILIHCSDGWDRTSQLCALSQILLDKYYRTLDGFICLIEKDWISFGHQFRYRNGLYSQFDSKVSDNQFSPIFVQWLDCIYQIMEQNYTKFEFNFNLLTFLAEEVYAGKYGTFLFNNEKEREIYDAENKTLSIWNYVKENEDTFINYIYDPEDNGQLVINYKRVKLWSDYFYRFEKGGNGYLKEFERKNKKDKMIIEKFCQFIASKCKKEDINKIDYDCKTLINQFTGKNV